MANKHDNDVKANLKNKQLAMGRHHQTHSGYLQSLSVKWHLTPFPE